MILLPALPAAKKVKGISIVLLIAICLPVVLLAQNTSSLTVSGQVSDNKNNPLQDITIVLKGTDKGTTTDVNGHFVLSEVPANGVLVFSSTGFVIQEFAVKGKSTINISLAETVSNLNEVVVIGYGTRQKKDVTGAVSQIKATQFENENPNSVQDILRGNIAGLDVTTTTSAKGGGSVLVRGKSSLSAGTSPLIVLDGVIYPGQMSDINPHDISTIDVLKDASSAAVFGAKAASGVILISTKKASTGKTTIAFNTNVGLSTLAMDQPLYDGPGFLGWRRDVLKSVNNGGQPFQFDDPRTLPSNISIAQWKSYDGLQGDSITIWLTRLKLFAVEQQNYKDGKTINWYDMMFQKGLRTNNTISISSRKEDVSFYMSLNYLNNQGIIVGDKFSTVRTRINLEAKAAKFLSLGINMQYADRDESQVPVNWPQMINASPYGEKYKADGITLRDSPNDDIGNNTNPFLDNTYTTRLQKENTLFGSVYAKGNLPFGFSYQTNFTPYFQFYRFFDARSAQDFRVAVRKGVATRTEQTAYNWQVDNLLNWNKVFGDHQIDATFLVYAQKFQVWRNQIDNEGFEPNTNLTYHNIGAGIKPVVSSNDEVSTGDAIMGRLNYSFRQKYLLTASLRRDGFSAFGLENPRATFPAIALGWIFSKEKFASSKFLSFAKLRASWGINGNSDIGRYQALANLATGRYQYISPSGAITVVSSLASGRLPKSDLKWERTESYNLGLDYSILKDRIGGSIDVYRKSTKDLLVSRTIPDVIGFRTAIDNIGEVQNKGIELSLNTVNIKSENFSWRSTVNFSLNRNKVAHLYGLVPLLNATGEVIGEIEKNDIVNLWFIGHDIDEIWDLKVLGVWQQNEAAEAAKYNVKPGDFKVEDVNGDGAYSNEDRQFLGFTTPRFNWTFRNSFTFFKNFDFSFMLYSAWGQNRSYNQAKNNSGFIDRQNSYVLPYWTPENPTNEYARLFSSNGSSNFFVYRNGSFIRLSTIALGYTVPKALLDRAKIGSLKIFMNVSNAAIYQPNWTFWDVEYGNTPPPRTYSFGISLIL
jgi:TonB-dependent starch-binding outer membrane protein SusC